MDQIRPARPLPATRVDHTARAERHEQQARADRAANPGLTGAARAAAWRMLARAERQR